MIFGFFDLISNHGLCDITQFSPYYDKVGQKHKRRKNDFAQPFHLIVASSHIDWNWHNHFKLLYKIMTE